jgi:hypothetical protein
LAPVPVSPRRACIGAVQRVALYASSYDLGLSQLKSSLCGLRVRPWVASRRQHGADPGVEEVDFYFGIGLQGLALARQPRDHKLSLFM